jgi:dephospho-CoA kinase
LLLVGLTGGIGAGKSTVSTLLAERGAVIIDADQVARDLQRPGSSLLAAMAERFGATIIRGDGSLDRAAVAAIVFGDAPEAKQTLADLNAITHPAIQEEIRRRLQAEEGTDHIVVLDHPLLGEHPRDDLAATIVVDIPVETAVGRLVESRGMDEADARRRIASQMRREDRLAKATHVVDNSSDLDHLCAQVDALWPQLLALRDGAANA